ncbi:MAG: type II asparaginase [Janthinobacterium lividum]
MTNAQSPSSDGDVAGFMGDAVPLSAAVLPRLALLATGGTIAGAGTDPAATARYRAGAIGIDRLLAAVPALAELAVIEAEQLVNIDSKDMSEAVWLALAKRANELLARADIDGLVITHGTDTLEETAYWLHLTLNSDKPVVLTAAMRPATALSADGPANLFDAVVLAASPSAIGRGVLVTLGHRIHSARDIAKVNTYALDALASPETGVLGWVQDRSVRFERAALRRHTRQSEFARRFAGLPGGQSVDVLPEVALVVSHALASRRLVDALVAAGVPGIVVAGTGNGSIHSAIQQALVDAVAQGVAVVRASRTGAGPVLQGAAAADDIYGFVASGSLNAYKARILLTLALLSGDASPARLKRLFDDY